MSPLRALLSRSEGASLNCSRRCGRRSVFCVIAVTCQCAGAGRRHCATPGPPAGHPQSLPITAGQTLVLTSHLGMRFGAVFEPSAFIWKPSSSHLWLSGGHLEADLGAILGPSWRDPGAMVRHHSIVISVCMMMYTGILLVASCSNPKIINFVLAPEAGEDGCQLLV